MQTGNLCRGKTIGDVTAAGFEQKSTRGIIRHNLIGNFFDFCNIAEVIVISFECCIFVYFPFHKFEGTGSAGMKSIILPILFQCRRADNRGSRMGKPVQHGADLGGRGDIHRIIIQHINRGDHFQNRTVGGTRIRIQNSLQGDLYSLCGKCTSIMKFYFLTKFEGPGKSIIGNSPVFGEISDNIHVVVKCYQIAVQASVNAFRSAVIADLRIEAGEIASSQDGQFLILGTLI